MLMLAVDAGGRQALLVGGGPVAERKVRTLLEAGARVRVVSPDATLGLRDLAAEGRLEWLARAYQPGDAAGAWLTIAATGDREADRAVADAVKETGGLVSVSGDPAQGNVHFPAEVRRGPVTIGIATGGASPALARHLRAKVARVVGPEYGLLADLLAEARHRLRSRPDLDQAQRAAIYAALLEGPLLSLLADGQLEAARVLLEEQLSPG